MNTTSSPQPSSPATPPALPIAPPFPTYPALPVEGGPLHKAPKRTSGGPWVFEFRYQGRRLIADANNQRFFDRDGALLPPEEKEPYMPALQRLGAVSLEWTDVIALPSGVLMAIDNLDMAREAYWARKARLFTALRKSPHELDISQHQDTVLTPCFFPEPEARRIWDGLRDEYPTGHPIYSGVIGKRIDLSYPLQTLNPRQLFSGWVCHRL